MLGRHPEKALIARVTSKGTEVGIVLNPAGNFWSGGQYRTFQQVECDLKLLQLGIAARHIILSQGIVGIDGQSARDPFSDPLSLAPISRPYPTISGEDGPQTTFHWHPEI